MLGFYEAEICVSALMMLLLLLCHFRDWSWCCSLEGPRTSETFFHILDLDTFEVSFPAPPLPSSNLSFFLMKVANVFKQFLIHEIVGYISQASLNVM